MTARRTLHGAGIALFALALAGAGSALAADAQDQNGQARDAQKLESISPGHSTKDDVKILLGAPWRIVQFNDCGMAMDDQADETWEYRIGPQDMGSQDKYRIHVEFDDQGVVHLVAKIRENAPDGAATTVKVAPMESATHAM